MTTDEASQILREMILATFDDDELAEMGEQGATYALRLKALKALEAERDDYRTLAWDAILRVRNDHGQLDELWQRYQALKGGGDE